MRSEPAYYLGSQYVNFLINHVFYSFAAAFYTWILWVTVIILLQYKLWTKKLFATDVKCEQTVTDSHPDFDTCLLPFIGQLPAWYSQYFITCNHERKRPAIFYDRHQFFYYINNSKSLPVILCNIKSLLYIM